MKGWLLVTLVTLFLCHEACCKAFQHCNERMPHVKRPRDSEENKLLMDSLNHHYDGFRGEDVHVLKHLTSNEFQDVNKHKMMDHYFKFQLGGCRISVCIRVENVDKELRYHDEYEIPGDCQLAKREGKGSNEQREHALGAHTGRAKRLLNTVFKQPASLSPCTHPERKESAAKCKTQKVVEVEDPVDSTRQEKIIRDIHWDRSQKFTSKCRTYQKMTLWVNNPTSESVKLQFYAEKYKDDNLVPVHATHVIQPHTYMAVEGFELLSVQVTVLEPSNRAKIMELPYLLHSVILIALDNEPQPHVSWNPTDLVISDFTIRDKHVPDYEMVRKTYHARSARMKAVPGPRDSLSLSANAGIPKIIHWVWLGGKIPKLSTRMMHSVYLHHQERGWEFRLWIDHADQQDLGPAFWKVFKGLHVTIHKVTEFELVNTPFYKHAREVATHFAMCSDIIRISALHKYGGIYMDHDIAAVASIDHLASNFGFFAPQFLGNNYPEVFNDILGTRKGHQCIEALYAQLSLNVKSETAVSRMPKKQATWLLRKFVFEMTGPSLVGSVVMNLLPELDDMIVLPPSYLSGNLAFVKDYLAKPETEDFVGVYPETITFTYLAGKWNG